MKTPLLFLPLAALALLGTSCDDDDHGCDPAPACTSGTVLGHTCSVGTLIQLHNARGGQTIRYDNGSGLKTYNHVIATYSDLDSFDEEGTTFYFTYRKGGAGTPPEVQCLAYDAPADMKPYTLTNLSANGCDEVHTQTGN